MDNGASSYYRYLAGDDSALGDIVRDYKDGLTIYLNSFTNNIHDAEELMEETFVELIMKKPKFSGKSSFKTWLYAIGRNITYDYLKKRSKNYDLPIDELYDISDELGMEFATASLHNSFYFVETKNIIHDRPMVAKNFEI